MHAFSFTETKAAEYAASMMKKSDWTVRRWRSALIDNEGAEIFHGNEPVINEAILVAHTY